MIGPFRRALGYFPAIRRRWLKGMACIPAANGIDFILLFIVADVVDGIDQGTMTFGGVVARAAIVLGLVLVKGAAKYGMRYYITGASREFEKLYRQDLFQHLLTLTPRDLSFVRTGDIMSDGCTKVSTSEMGDAVLAALRRAGLPKFRADATVVNCHHNYVQRETHYGREVFVTRKGAVRAGAGELGIIPGSMGARSYIVRGKGNAESFESCSHGAGRRMSRRKAKSTFTLEDHERATRGVECRKDPDVIDETPGAYKPIEDVMAAQQDLVHVVHTLKQVVCVKG